MRLLCCVGVFGKLLWMELQLGIMHMKHKPIVGGVDNDGERRLADRLVGDALRRWLTKASRSFKTLREKYDTAKHSPFDTSTLGCSKC